MNKKNHIITLKTEFITLGQLLKLTNTVATGGEVKNFLTNNLVKVNDESEKRRGRKLYKGDVVDFDSCKITLK